MNLGFIKNLGQCFCLQHDKTLHKKQLELNRATNKRIFKKSSLKPPVSLSPGELTIYTLTRHGS